DGRRPRLRGVVHAGGGAALASARYSRRRAVRDPLPRRPTMTPSTLDAATDRRFTARDFALEGGAALPEMTLAFETYGRLAPDGANAILITHGFTGSHRAAGPPTPSNPAGGWWDKLIGPGKAIDTDRYFAVSSNMLGSSYGSTGPGSTNPATG